MSTIIKNGNILKKVRQPKEVLTPNLESLNQSVRDLEDDLNTFPVELQSLTSDNVTHLQNITTPTFELSENLTALDPVKIIDSGGVKIKGLTYTFESVSSSFSAIARDTGSVSVFYSSYYDRVLVATASNSTNIINTYIPEHDNLRLVDYGVATGYATGTFYAEDDSGIIVIIWTNGTSILIRSLSITSDELTVDGTDTLVGEACNIINVDTGKFLLVRRDGVNVYAQILTVSGSTITAGSANTIASNAYDTSGIHLNVTYDITEDKYPVTYIDSGNDPWVVVLTVSGTTVTAGTGVELTTNGFGARVQKVLYHPVEDVHVLVAESSSSTTTIRTIAFRVTGTTVSAGSSIDISISRYCPRPVFISGDNKILVLSSANNTTLRYYELSVSGLTLTNAGYYDAENPIGIAGRDTQYGETASLDYIPKLNSIISPWQTGASGGYTTSTMVMLNRFNSTEYDEVIGLLTETGTTGESKRVATEGCILDGFTGQTPGALAYIQEDGTTDEVVTPYPIGRFISATELYVTKDP